MRFSKYIFLYTIFANGGKRVSAAGGSKITPAIRKSTTRGTSASGIGNNNSSGSSSDSDASPNKKIKAKKEGEDAYDSDSEDEYDEDSEDEYDEDAYFDINDMDNMNKSDYFDTHKRPSVLRIPETAPYNHSYQFGTKNTRSTTQNSVLHRLRQKLKVDVSQPLIDENAVYIPKSRYENANMINLDPLRINKLGSPKRGVYFVTEDGKIGRSVDLQRRSKEYNNIAGIIIIFDYDLAEENVTDQLKEAIINIANDPDVKLEDGSINGLTIAKITELEENGLSIFPRILFHLVANDKAGDIQGILNALNLQNVESALGVTFKEDYGIQINEQAALDEHFICELMKWVGEAMNETDDMAYKFFERLTRDEWNDLVKNKHEVKAILSWARAKTDTEKKAAAKGLKKLDPAKVLVMKNILGVSGRDDSDGYWFDTIYKTPGEGSETFNKANYSKPDKDAGVKKLETYITKVEEEGGIRALDINELIMNHIETNMVDWLERRGWEAFYSCLDMIVLRYIGDTTDKKARMLFVNRPACWTLFSGQYKLRDRTVRPMNDRDTESQARRCKTGDVLQKIFQVLTTENETLNIKSCTTVRSPRRSNLLIAFAFRMYLLKNLHVFPMVATLLAKYLLVEHINPLEEYYNGLLASKHGTNLKAQRKSRRGPTEYDLDKQITSKLNNVLSTERSDDDPLDEDNPILNKGIDVLLNEDGSGYGKAQRVTGDVKKRLDRFNSVYLLESGKTIYDTLFKIAEKKNNSKVTASIESWKNVDSGEGKEKSESEDGSDNGSDDGSANGSDDGSDNESDTMGFMGALKKYK